MLLKRAYFAYCVKDDKDVFAIGGRGDLNAKNYFSFIRSQSTMERYQINSNQWSVIKCRLNEGRYHASACLIGKWIYVFGGYRTKRLVGQYQV